MRRPAVLVFGVAACWTGRDASAPPAIANRAVVQAPTLAGAYRCSITEGDYKYPPFPCAIRSERGKLVLAKLGGSVRFEGEIQPRRAGFAFHGHMFCPWGDCAQDLDGSFVARGDQYFGSFTDDHMTVELERASGGYGGDSYGGDRYGGATYGNLGPSGRPRNPPP